MTGVIIPAPMSAARVPARFGRQLQALRGLRALIICVVSLGLWTMHGARSDAGNYFCDVEFLRTRCRSQVVRISCFLADA